MEFIKSEIAIVEKAVTDSTAASISELDDLQLALIGGGVGEVSLN
jgi:uncharacterized membrane protein YsdA (DUF1294 family)